MMQHADRLWITSTRIANGLAEIMLGLCLSMTPAIAQVIPDGTTPTNVGNCGSRCVIDGGTARGVHLFHSFQDGIA
jgi:hypothetical protein